MTLVALPLIFQKFWDARKFPAEPVLDEIMEMVKVYNGIEPGDEMAVRQEIGQAYRVYWQNHGTSHA